MKSLTDILKGVKKSSTKALTTGSEPGVDYADKMKDTRDFVAKHSVEKHEDRVGNGDEVYKASKVKQSKDENHGHTPEPKSKNAYKKANQISETIDEAKDSREYGYEGEMAVTKLKTIIRSAENLMKMMKPNTDLPEWVQSKIIKAEDYITTANDYLSSEMSESKHEKEDDDSDDQPMYDKKKGKKLLLDVKKKIEERTMTASEKTKEEKLKDKYDDSGMKASMQKQYGKEKGKQVYFAYIRKKAMKSEQTAPADTTIQFPSMSVGDTGRV